MSKVAVVYWSGTGNTEMMAQKVAEGAKEAGAEVSVLTCADFSADDVDAYDAIAFGCPARGAEELEVPSSSQCSPHVNPNSPERKSLCSVPMDGETASGCAPGKKAAKMMAPSWYATA